mgnify:FL=1
MGLLEKAGQIESDKPSVDKPEIVDPESVKEASEPIVQPDPVKTKKEKRSRRKKTKKPREKKVKPPKVLPEDSELASPTQFRIKKYSDFLVSWGWTMPLVGFTAWGNDFQPTIFVLAGMGLIGFNLGFMAYTTGRTTGNWITRTIYVNTKGEKPHQSYIFLKGMTFPLVILGIIAILTATATGLSENAGKIQLALGLFFLLPPLLDYLFFRFKSDDLGLWDTLYGGVWLVKTAKTAESKGWLKRLEQLGDYTEAQGWLSDGDSKESSD